MKKLFLSLIIAVTFFAGFSAMTNKAYADVSVNGYYRSNGTYVEPYTRSNPDGDPYNNYSYPGNYNPYTGNYASGNADTYLNNYYGNYSDYSYGNDTYSDSSYSDYSSGY